MSGRARTAREGFTLVELTVALAGAGLLAGALMTLVTGQTRFQARSDEATRAQQNLRVLVDVVGAEIRGASPGDLVLATPDSLGLRADLLRAVVCRAAGPGMLDIFVFDSVSTANVPRSFRGTAVAGPYEGVYGYADGYAPAAAPDAGAEAACRARGADPVGAAPSSSFRRVTGWSPPVATTAVRGSILRVYGRLDYALTPSTTDPGSLAVRRNGQELATPLAPGARFEYVLADGSVLGRVGPAKLMDVRRVRVHARAATRGFGPGRRISFDVPLRD